MPTQSRTLVHSEVTTPDALMYFVMAFAAGPSAFDPNATYPDVKFYAEAEAAWSKQAPLQSHAQDTRCQVVSGCQARSCEYIYCESAN